MAGDARSDLFTHLLFTSLPNPSPLRNFRFLFTYLNPEVVVDTEKEGPDDCVTRIIAKLRKLGYIKS